MHFATKPTICVIGLGYVGLPLAVLFGKKDIKVYGYARTQKRIEELRNNYDKTNEVSSVELKKSRVEYSSNPTIISKSNFIIVAVPTPVDKAHIPDLEPVRSASELVGKHLVKNSVVIFESTVYPGVTEEICVPIIEQCSKLTCGKDWVVGYSPERTNPGDKEKTPENITKITSGMNKKTGEYIDRVYKKIIKAGTYLAKNIKTAEAAKVIENTQRDINIAIVNEFSMIFKKLNLNNLDILEAAGSKWNFLKFKPGLVGGHCIGVDPYYLVHKAEIEGYHPQLISVARRINDGMASYCANQIVKQLIQADKTVNKSKILIMGATFKPDVKDNRNSKVAELIHELQQYKIDVYLHDPHLIFEDLGNAFCIDKKHFVPQYNRLKYIDGICYAVNHELFSSITLRKLATICKKKSIFFDIPGRFHKQNIHVFSSYQNL